MTRDPERSGLVRVGLSRAADPAQAVAEATAGLGAQDSCFVLAFVPDRLRLDTLAGALGLYLPRTAVYGCTTAGQITPSGYETAALQLLAFPKAHFRCASMLIEPLTPVSIGDTADGARRLATQFRRTAGWNRLALVFADGLSKQEDLLVAGLGAGLEDVAVFGGSAGNGLDQSQTFVLHDGVFRSDAALVLLLETDLGIAGIGFDHFEPTGKQMVVTGALPDERLVTELNGSPAAAEYARMVGCAQCDLSPSVFAANPVLVRNNGASHVRAIREVGDGGSLSLLSAIDDGLVLTLGRGTDILRTLDAGLDVVDERGGRPDFILGFDCYLRRLEFEQKGIAGEVSEILRRRRVVGFNTYGEQHRGVHVNQTFVGVAFFEPRRRDLE